MKEFIEVAPFSVCLKYCFKHVTSAGQLHIFKSLEEEGRKFVLVADPQLVVSLLNPVHSLFGVPVQTNILTPSIEPSQASQTLVNNWRPAG